MKKSKLTTKQIVLTGMMTAVLAVLSIVTIPLPTGVPVTLQTFAMAFCGYVLGWKLGGASSALYLILGAIGVPVYAGMSGGFGALLGPAGGFIFGFIPMAMLCGAGIKKGFPGKPFVLGIAGRQSEDGIWIRYSSSFPWNPGSEARFRCRCSPSPRQGS